MVGREILQATLAGLIVTFLLPFTISGMLLLITIVIGQPANILSFSCVLHASAATGLLLSFGIFFSGRWTIRLTVIAAGAATVSYILAYTSTMASTHILLTSPLIVMGGVLLFMAFGVSLLILREAAVRLGIDP